MLRLLHTADVHLGARHTDLGERAAAQRERQFAAFQRTVQVALDQRVDLFLIAGDLFDSNTQPRRSVERAAGELRRLAQATIRTVILPGTHDVYDRSSVYRAHDIAALAGLDGSSDLLVVLSPDRPEVVHPALDAIVYGRCFATKRAPESPLAGLDAAADGRASWHIGLVHGALAIPGSTDRDDVVITQDEIAASGLDYLALGHWHSTYQGRAGRTQFAYSGAPEPVAVDQDRAGNVLVVTLDGDGDDRRVSVEEVRVGRTRFQRVDFDAGELSGQSELLERLRGLADTDLVLDVELRGIRHDELDLDADEIEAILAPDFMNVRVRDHSVAALSEGSLPPPDTIAGAFERDLMGQIAALEADGRAVEALELRDSLRTGRLLLAGREIAL
jgi:DNA repair exonuclease SbcCD nuclease subunit